MAFQVTSPFDRTRCLLPHALVMHVNPQSMQVTHNKQVERIQTRGGWVEQHWGDQLDEISCNGSTGAFMNIYTGLSAVLRQRTIAWDRFRDLHDLFRNNGSVYDPAGNIVLQGQIMLMYDLGVYTGTFRTFQFEETAESPFAFQVNWSFKVEHILVQFPGAGSGAPVWGPSPRAPAFQGQNTLEAPNRVAAKKSDLQEAPVEKAVPTPQEVQAELNRQQNEQFRRDLGLPPLEQQLRQERQYAAEQAAAQAAVRRDREEQMHQATGYDPNYNRQRQSQELGLSAPPSVPTTHNPGPPRGNTGR
jgi:hypothetical protein